MAHDYGHIWNLSRILYCSSKVYVKDSYILMEMEGCKRLSLLIFLLAVQIVNDAPYIPDHLSPDLADLLKGLLCKGGFLLPWCNVSFSLESRECIEKFFDIVFWF